MAYVDPNPVMTGAWLAVAGAGFVTVTPRSGYGPVEWATGATAPDVDYQGGLIGGQHDRSFQVPSGEELFLRGAAGYIVAIDRETAPA